MVRTKALVIPTIVTQLYALKPVIDKLKERGAEVTTLRYEIGYRNHMKNMMDKMGIEYTTLRSLDYTNKRNKSRFQKSIKKFINKLKPNIIIVCDFSSSLMHPVMAYAKEIGIPTLAVQWAFIEDFFQDPYQKPPIVDKIAVSSEADRKILIENFRKRGWIDEAKSTAIQPI